MHLLTPTHTFDRAAIMRAAHAEARAKQARYAASRISTRYAVLLRHALAGI